MSNPVFNTSGSYSTVYTQKGVYFLQNGNYFDPAFNYISATPPADRQSMSSERSDVVNIIGGSIDGVTIGSNSTINASVSGNVTNAAITGSTITGGSINGTPIGQSTPAAGAFTGLNSTSANILGPMSAEGVNATTNGQPASTTNSGVVLGSSTNWASETFYDPTRGTDAKTADVVWQSGVFSFRYKNDSGASATTWLQATGAYNAITGIASSSGTGDWAHTGTLKTTGVVTLSQGFIVANLPAASTALKGARAFVTDSASPTYNAQVVGGGANTVPVFCNGNVWVWA